ncbi:DUF4190 domain-containing protein [Cellulomonas xylanilytica]|uniref:DUF4190 domain-containing protein n=1 Tax=Cellulomonas xylanilytica TaxID=233583 RepID=A0A510V6J8_9CELL|nr:DUF4190 domain-containing protein [Cellulomonas xylanilytica]GEK22416.1 hypothetical protein CXY01_29360 [Cellulomonas xylanilytica]
MHYAPGWTEPRARLEPTAVWSLVTGVLGLGPVALGLAVVAFRRIATRHTRGRGLAIAGAVLGTLGTIALVVGVTVAVLTVMASRPLPTDVPAPRDARAQQLVTGNCVLSLPDDGPVDTVRVVPCAEPHEAQVVTEFTFAPAAVWPGQQAADARVARACVLDAEEIDAGVRTVTWSPTERSWARGDRVGLCLAVVDGGGVTGSFLDRTAELP